MSYFGFLGLFLLPPMAVLAWVLWRNKQGQPVRFGAMSAWAVLALHVVIAVTWTTPWDNYLVATSVWWYDPELVSGLVLGYVPIEEYTFFVLQPILTGLWLIWLMRQGCERANDSVTLIPFIRPATTFLLALGWVILLILWLADIDPLTYLCLELLWAIPPLMLQAGFGADILWRHRRLVAVAILVPTLYLSLADSIAIGSGTWTIDPQQSTDLLLFGVLPIEELLFFLLTNTMLVFGMVLALSPESLERVKGMRLPSPSLTLLSLWLITMIIIPILGWTHGIAIRNIGIQFSVVFQTLAILSILIQSWSLQRILTVFVAIATFTLLTEAIGTATGLPFGEYTYTDQLQPQLLHVPLLIPLAWFMILPLAWAIADPHRHTRWQFALIAGIATTAWDLFLDPQMVNWGFWTWATNGAYFGIPLTNYVGWMLTATHITALLHPHIPALTNPQRHALLTIYTLTWLLETIGLALFWSQLGPAVIGGLIMGTITLYGWKTTSLPHGTIHLA